MKGEKNVPGLNHTPGKLLTGKGPIPGYLSAFGTVWGKIKVTGDEAQEMMGFRPKEGAIGVLLSRRKYTDKNGKVKKGIFASSLMPRKLPDTEKEKATTERMRIVTHIASKYHDDLIVPIWNPLIKNDRKKPYTGYHYFMSWNLKHVGTGFNWQGLLISNGRLKAPGKIYPNWYDSDTNEIKICIPSTIYHCCLHDRKGSYSIGIGIADIITGSFFHIAPDQLIKQVQYIWELENIRKNYNPKGPTSYKRHSRFYIYMYYRRQISEDRCQKTENRRQREEFEYSPSISSRIRMDRNRQDKIGTKPIIIKVQPFFHSSSSN